VGVNLMLWRSMTMDLFAEYIFHNTNRNKQLRMPSLLCTVTKSCSENNIEVNGIIRQCI